ncbi:MAG: AarF/UbiB family protein [Chloroflexota bacterium]|nr:AarF/UbiB family protein [Chloroflexota bacterium]
MKERIPLMHQKLEEKRRRQQIIEQRREAGANRSVLRQLTDFVSGSASYTIFLIVEGNLLRALEIGFRLVEAILLWILDWIVYPIRFLSGWRLMTAEATTIEETFAQKVPTFHQHSLSIYVAREKPTIWRRIMFAFQNLGPAFLKLGQIISMLPILPFSAIAEFAKLCDYLPAESDETIRALIKQELGASPEELFAYMDNTPLGAASFAQVHAIVLKNGEDAVIKLQRPGLKDKLQRDFRILEPVAGILELFLKPLRPFIKAVRDIRPVEILVDYAEATAIEELDLAYEGTTMQMTHNSLEMYGVHTQCRIPGVYWEYTTEKVLVMERMFFYFKGVQLDVGNPHKLYKFWDFLRAFGYDLSLAARKRYRATWQPFLCHGVKNLDIHHGNYMFCYDDIMAQVDYGISYYAGGSKWLEGMRPGLCRLWGGLGEQDAALVLESAKNLGVIMGLEEKKAQDRATEELGKMLNTLATISEQPGMSGDWMMDVLASVKGPQFLAREMTGIIMALAREARIAVPYDLLNLIRMVPYTGTAMTIFAPEFDLLGESRALQGYWIGDYDGTQPFKGTNIYPEPKIPFDPDRYWNSRTDEEIKADEEELCVGTLWVNKDRKESHDPL